MNALTDPIYNDENKAREHLEALRWPNGPECPHCGSVNNAKRLEGKASRPGLLNCRDCRKQFSVTVGTVFERSKIPLTKWLACSYLMASSKKGISSHQIHRTRTKLSQYWAARFAGLPACLTTRFTIRKDTTHDSLC